jgi:ribosomal protein S18 acetylase RimI-like enzyme
MPGPAPLTIAPALPTDVPAVVDLVTAAYRAVDDGAGWTTESHLLSGQRTDTGEVTRAVDDPATVLLVARDDEGLVGCIRVDPVDPDGAHFGLFAVDPARQSTGTGGRLLDAAEHLARSDWGRAWMELEVLHQRPDLQAWYRRRGYEPTGETQPFPTDDPAFGVPKVADLHFDVLRRPLIP